MMTGFILFVPAVSGHVLIAVSNTVMPATAPVPNAGRYIYEGDTMLSALLHKTSQIDSIARILSSIDIFSNGIVIGIAPPVFFSCSTTFHTRILP